MTDPLRQAGPILPAAPFQAQPGPPAPSAPGKDFKSLLLDNLSEVNRLQSEADRQVQRLVTGETDNVAEVFMAINKSGVAFDLLMEVRNKLIDAYDEIKQMSV
ncbi:MAG: flagellar hook-basal body complex protein FliE [Phycisphaerales bacterium]|nr:MAG: flagellar hook-basal body complex protein FliE [Phycisphaerales bacterium]